MFEAKFCVVCQKPLIRRATEGHFHWGKRKSCSHFCANQLRYPYTNYSAEQMQEYLRSISVINEKTGCWLFRGATLRKPGHTSFKWRGKREAPYRTSFRAFEGDIPDDKEVCHTCDNTHCINPSHLFLGTHQENMDDMVAKKRQVHGERVTGAKLTPAQVIQIYKATGSNAAIARRYRVSDSTIREIRQLKTWRSVLEPIAARKARDA